MAKQTVNCSVTKTGGIQGYWIAIDGVKKKMVANECVVQLSTGKHLVHWHMVGNAPDSITIELKSGGKSLLKVTDPIPKKDSQGGGFDSFTV